MTRQCTSWRGHRWKQRYDLNSGFWHQGALARKGEMCTRCAAVRFPETDQEYFDRLPEWLRTSDALVKPRFARPDWA